MPLTGPRPGQGEVSGAEIDGMAVVLANVGGSLLAFRDACAACGEAIAGGRLKGGVLACPDCGRRYYLPRAGRSMDEERLLLEPVPLLESGGEVTVAVPR
jgi:nitrite reductase/ring-hydroxylating ferredoxin subunit